MGVVPETCTEAVGANIGSHSKCKTAFLGVVVDAQYDNLHQLVWR